MTGIDYGSDQFDDMIDTMESSLGDGFSTPGDLSSTMYQNYRNAISTDNPLRNIPSDSFDQTEDDFLSIHSQFETAREASETVFGLGGSAAASAALHLSVANATNGENLLRSILTDRGFPPIRLLLTSAF